MNSGWDAAMQHQNIRVRSPSQNPGNPERLLVQTASDVNRDSVQPINRTGVVQAGCSCSVSLGLNKVQPVKAAGKQNSGPPILLQSKNVQQPNFLPAYARIL